MTNIILKFINTTNMITKYVNMINTTLVMPQIVSIEIKLLQNVKISSFYNVSLIMYGGINR